MNLKTKFINVTILFSLFSITLSSDAQEVLTIDRAYALALENYEVVAIGREDIVQGKEDVWKVLSQVMPLITVDGRYTTYTEQKNSTSGFLVQPEDSSRVDVRLVQPLYSGGRASNAYKQVKKTLEIKKNNFELTKEDVLIATASAFYNVLKAKGNIEIKDAAYKRALKYKKAARLRLKVGIGTKADLLSSEAEEAGANAELIRADSELVDARIVLGRFIGSVILEGGLNVIEPETSKHVLDKVEKYVDDALMNRKDLENSITGKEITEHGISFVKGSFLPTLSLEGQYSYREQTPETTFFQNEQSSASLVLNYPIFEGGLRKAELDEARSRRRQAELQLTLLRKDIEVEVRRAYNNVVYLNNLIKSFSKQKDFAEENYHIVFKQYKLGLVGSVDVTTADSLLVKSGRDYIAVKFDYEVALLKLKKSSGSLVTNMTDSLIDSGETFQNKISDKKNEEAVESIEKSVASSNTPREDF